MKNQSRKEFIRTCCLITAGGLGLHGVFNCKALNSMKKTDLENGKMIAYCGIICSDCPAYIATQKNDNKMRKETAEKWSKEYNSNFKPEDINCDGCISNSDRLIGHCLVCEIRKCGKEKGVKNCAYCNEYPCTKLSEFLKMVPKAKTTLDEIRKKVKE